MLRHGQRMLRMVLVLAIVAAAGAFTMAPAGAAVVPYTSTPTNAWWTDGPIRTGIISGDVLYIGGSFSALVNAKGDRIPRANLAAIRLSDGQPVDTFSADTNGTVRALVMSGNRLFVGGTFTTVRGLSRNRLAAVDPATGAVSSFRVGASSHVFALSVAGDRLYVGGAFGNLGGMPRTRMGAVNLTTNTLVADFAPVFDGSVLGIDAPADGSLVYAAGLFNNVNAQPRIGLVQLDTTGATTPVAFNNLYPTWDVDVTPDGAEVYLGIAGSKNSGGSYDPASGAERWRHRVDGDVQAIERIGDNTYLGFHEGWNGDTALRLLGVDSASGEINTDFLLRFTRYWGVWALTGDADRLVVMGDFALMGGAPQQNLAILPRQGAAPAPAPAPDPAPAPAPVGTELVATNAAWRYQPYSDTAAAAWMQPGFDDTAWTAGAAELGYGDGGEATVLPTKQAITWFRTSFTNTGVPASLNLSLVADDGAVVYLNGVEVHRDNVGPGPLTVGTRALTSRTGADEHAVREVALPTDQLVEGTNVIAVAVYQDCGCSTDLSFSARLAKA